MNAKFTNMNRYALGAGLLLCGVLAAPANTLVTFQVDMSVQVSKGAFDPAANVVNARGTFNTWGSFSLTNDPAATNPYLYSETVDDTTDPNGGTLEYKYWTDAGGDTWESPLSTGGNNRTAALPATSGSSLVLPVVYFGDVTPVVPTNNVTFQVDMLQQVVLGNFSPDSQSVYARGAFNNWGTYQLTNNPTGPNTNLFTGTYGVVATAGLPIDYKFYFNPGDSWETRNNRQFTVAGGDQTLPVVYFDDKAPVQPVTNDVSFTVDLSAQVLSGHFDPNLGDFVEVRGSFANNWAGGVLQLTNDPAALNTNLYSGTYTIKDVPSANEQYKFVMNGGTWENPLSTGGGNRSFSLLSTNGTLALPAVFFGDLALNDLVTKDTLVTFRVSMTNAVNFKDQTPFDPSSQLLFMNGNFLPPNANWLSWDAVSLAPFNLTNNPVGSKIYTLTMLVPKGTSLALTYKYGIDGGDNEAAQDNNHVRYIRTLGEYTMPLDTFGTQLVEPSFGNLQAGAASAGRVPITWLGRPGVQLQTSPDLSPGSWQNHPETDGLSATNWPISSGAQYFRLYKPGI